MEAHELMVNDFACITIAGGNQQCRHVVTTASLGQGRSLRSLITGLNRTCRGATCIVDPANAVQHAPHATRYTMFYVNGTAMRDITGSESLSAE